MPKDGWLDTQFATYGSNRNPTTSMLFGPNFLSSKLYQLSPIEVRKLILYPILYVIKPYIN